MNKKRKNAATSEKSSKARKVEVAEAGVAAKDGVHYSASDQVKCRKRKNVTSPFNVKKDEEIKSASDKVQAMKLSKYPTTNTVLYSASDQVKCRKRKTVTSPVKKDEEIESARDNVQYPTVLYCTSDKVQAIKPSKYPASNTALYSAKDRKRKSVTRGRKSKVKKGEGDRKKLHFSRSAKVEFTTSRGGDKVKCRKRKKVKKDKEIESGAIDKAHHSASVNVHHSARESDKVPHSAMGGNKKKKSSTSKKSKAREVESDKDYFASCSDNVGIGADIGSVDNTSESDFKETFEIEVKLKNEFVSDVIESMLNIECISSRDRERERLPDDDICTYVSNNCFNKLRQIISNGLLFMKHCNRSTFTIEDFEKGLNFYSIGTIPYTFIPPIPPMYRSNPYVIE